MSKYMIKKGQNNAIHIRPQVLAVLHSAFYENQISVYCYYLSSYFSSVYLDRLLTKYSIY